MNELGFLGWVSFNTKAEEMIRCGVGGMDMICSG